MILEKIQNNDPESQLDNVISDFALIVKKYTNDIFYLETGNKLYKDIEHKDLNKMSIEKMNSYKEILDSKTNFFLNTFFSLFREFYRIYMKDWHKR